MAKWQKECESAVEGQLLTLFREICCKNAVDSYVEPPIRTGLKKWTVLLQSMIKKRPITVRSNVLLQLFSDAPTIMPAMSPGGMITNISFPNVYLRNWIGIGHEMRGFPKKE